MLRLTLSINADVICDYEVRNTGGGVGGTNTYTVRQITDDTTGPVLAQVQHFRPTGAKALAAIVLEELATQDLKDPRRSHVLSMLEQLKEMS